MKKTVCILLSLLLIMFVFSSCGETNVNVSINNSNENSNDIDIQNSGGSQQSAPTAAAPSGKPQLAGSYNLGDIVTFGSYEQDNNLNNGKEPIEWIVINRYNNEYILVSRYALDSKPYNNQKGSVNQSDATLEKWLINEFTPNAFTSDERSMLGESYNGKAAFMLSETNVIYDIEYDFDNYNVCSATAYAQARGSYVKNGACGWWLTNSDLPSANGYRVNIKGEILSDSSSEGGVERTDYSVRPAIILELS